MDILYRRFILVSAMIAVMGVFTANVIIETRKDNHQAIAVPGVQKSCGKLVLCRLDRPFDRLAAVAATRV